MRQEACLISNSCAQVAVLGTGNIGIDLCERILKDTNFELVAVVGRRPDSPGLQRFASRVPMVLSGGLNELIRAGVRIDGVFDATSAADHLRHWKTLRARGIWAIDMTPSGVGKPLIPILLGKVPKMQIGDQDLAANYSMVTCGAQSGAPLVHAVITHAQNVRQVEISSSIASRSAGAATRQNLDHYIKATENLLAMISGCAAVKAILVLNPAEPAVPMRTTVTVQADSFDFDSLWLECNRTVDEIRETVPGYGLTVSPYLSNDTISLTVRVLGSGHYLPRYAGNLDIINAAGVNTAKKHWEMYLNQSKPQHHGD